ncbi:MAG TPA: MFS transporter [Acidimicrobiia bacterium]|nr:MFS transporter [Acidimicrobiia bacterium]
MSDPAGTRLDRKGVGFGTIAVVVLLVAVYIGSEGLRWFDAALAPYLLGTLLAVFATVYRYVVWLRRPPTARLNRRGWEAMGTSGRLGSNLVSLFGMLVTNIALQRFIAQRSRTRWFAHQLLFWGCILAALVTFPLTFGWIHFESTDPTGRTYVAFLGPFATINFDSRSLVGWLMFHALNIAAVLVIAGVVIFLGRRLRDRGALAVERGSDFAALAGLFAVSVTGLMLTASSLWMEGRFYSFLNNLHALTVILGLLYIPFGKLFHILQRPANLGVAFYKQAGEESGEQVCVVCGEGFASQLQMADLKDVLPQLGFDYSTPTGDHYQDVCPRCRRRLVGLAQVDRVGGFG